MISKRPSNAGHPFSRRALLRAAGGAALLSAAASTLGSPRVLRGAEAEEIPIGQLHPLTGSLAFDGNQLRNGMLQAVGEINAAGGIKSLGGAKLKLLDGDTEGKPENAITEIERFNNQGCVAAFGCYQSAVTVVAAQQAEKFKLPFLVTVAVADEITGQGFRYTFRTQPKGEQMASQGLEHLAQIAKAAGVPVKTLSYLHDNTSFGQSLFAHAQKMAGGFGFEIVADVPYSPRATDVSTEIDKIKLAKADVVLASGYYADGLRVVRTLRDLRVEAKAFYGIGNGGFSHPKFPQDLGPLANYVMDANYCANPNSALTKEAFARYRKLYDSAMGPSTVFAYQPVYVLKDALERAASRDREAIREALARTHLSQHILPQGPIVFDATGQNANARAAVMQVLGGEVRVVWPQPYAEAKPVFPQPA